MPNLVAYDLAGVQPMSPVLLDLSLQCVHVTPVRAAQKPSTTKQILHSLVSLLDSTKLAAYADVNAGLGTTAQSGTNPSVLNPVGTATSTAYDVGEGMATGDC
jgi:hypothetical protein